MHSWREATEKAIGQKVNNTTLTDGSNSAKFSGTDTPTTMVAHQSHAPDEKTGGTQANTAVALDGHISLPASGKVADKNAFGLKPEYKTALRDFFVCLSQICLNCQ